ncbi:hypothetical protein [Anaerotignum lactatifermentans]|uniref:Uncharacterized protein n=1 Tax=Anaerotignum lactatifermentans DSM 14214 TaxID=1121323 RepID=A0A1M6N6K3_9FIRM|nr:hypothetical protein [Anaerotignum lactatifermentans]SHJ91340.1 hypothetical protein SAMN02745138_00783 [[Clostridium] lactatifermentans DSM 14214] [Anaerotignum lactatifermentans DSM 14214]
MAKKEIKMDLWVAAQLDECKIRFDAQGSNVKEINEALKSASKRGTGNVGYPEYTAVIGDFVLVIEDKANMDKQIKLTDSGIIDMSVKAVTDYAVNGAYFYAKHIAQNTAFKKVFAVGVSGDAKHHIITRCGWMIVRATSSCRTLNLLSHSLSRILASIIPVMCWKRQPTSRRQPSRF